MLHHVSMSWINNSNREMQYEMNETNHQYLLRKCPWLNRSICSKLHGSTFEDFITQERTDLYNLICSLFSHDRLQLDNKDYESSIGDREIPDDATIKTLEELGATFNFIDIWLKLLRENCGDICEAYINAMKDIFMQIPQNVEIALTPKEKTQKLMTDIVC